MKIAVFGAAGRIGSRIVKEALNRGHDVTAIVRRPEEYAYIHDHLKVAKGDLFRAQDVETGAFDQDAVVSAYSPPKDIPASTIAEVAVPLIKGLKQAHVKRLIVVGGAGSLYVEPGKQLIDMPFFPEEYKSTAEAHRQALKFYMAEQDLDWTVISPAAEIEPGDRTGVFRTGGNQLLKDGNGQSFITMEDYAAAVLDEIEKPQHIKGQMTVAY
ncbi:MAG: NAD(P)-dependent oxidoreductase [Mucilaginibacter sp.]